MRGLWGFASLALFTCAVPAFCQESAAVRLVGASAFGNMAVTPMIGGGLAFDRDEVVQWFGEGGLEVPARDVAHPAANGSGPIFGIVVQPGDLVYRIDRYAIGGVRLRHAVASPVTLFAEFGGGGARRLDQFRGVPAPSSLWYFVGSAGGGVFVSVTQTIGVEGGYRYGRLVHSDASAKMNKVYAALVLKLY